MDEDFAFDAVGLERALLLLNELPDFEDWDADSNLSENGMGSREALEKLATLMLSSAAQLGGPRAMAHMDPPTPWITWATALWNAALNQNLLHPMTSPMARKLEETAISWLQPFFGMSGGHMTSGSTTANLTALWIARERRGIDTVAASEASHVSVEKAANLLGLRLLRLRCDRTGRLIPEELPAEMQLTALVLTAGTTSTGHIEPLSLCGRAAWTHVDAAWAGPLRFCERYADRLAGIEQADSVAISAHKLMFQPKESALILFRDAEASRAAVTFDGPYLAAPNVGLQGSHGASGVPLLATLLAWGRSGLADRIERCMKQAEDFAAWIATEPRLELLSEPTSGLVVWRPHDPFHLSVLADQLPSECCSRTVIAGEPWFRNVVANPNANAETLCVAIARILDGRAPPA